MEVNSLDKNLLILIALELDLPNIIKFCQTSKRNDQAVCNNPAFWRQKLAHDFPDVNYGKNYTINPKAIYLFLNRIVNTQPELIDILPLLNIDKFKFMPLTAKGEPHFKRWQFQVRTLLNSLNRDILIKIVDDYNKDPLYAADEKIEKIAIIDIIDFLRTNGLIYEIEYKGYYEALVKELKYYLTHPEYTFDPAVWEIGVQFE